MASLKARLIARLTDAESDINKMSLTNNKMPSDSTTTTRWFSRCYSNPRNDILLLAVFLSFAFGTAAQTLWFVLQKDMIKPTATQRDIINRERSGTGSPHSFYPFSDASEASSVVAVGLFFFAVGKLTQGSCVIDSFGSRTAMLLNVGGVTLSVLGLGFVAEIANNFNLSGNERGSGSGSGTSAQTSEKWNSDTFSDTLSSSTGNTGNTLSTFHLLALCLSLQYYCLAGIFPAALRIISSNANFPKKSKAVNFLVLSSRIGALLANHVHVDIVTCALSAAVFWMDVAMRTVVGDGVEVNSVGVGLGVNSGDSVTGTSGDVGLQAHHSQTHLPTWAVFHRALGTLGVLLVTWLAFFGLDPDKLKEDKSKNMSATAAAATTTTTTTATSKTQPAETSNSINNTNSDVSGSSKTISKLTRSAVFRAYLEDPEYRYTASYTAATCLASKFLEQTLSSTNLPAATAYQAGTIVGLVVLETYSRTLVKKLLWICFASCVLFCGVEVLGRESGGQSDSMGRVETMHDGSSSHGKMLLKTIISRVSCFLMGACLTYCFYVPGSLWVATRPEKAHTGTLSSMVSLPGWFLAVIVQKIIGYVQRMEKFNHTMDNHTSNHTSSSSAMPAGKVPSIHPAYIASLKMVFLSCCIWEAGSYRGHFCSFGGTDGSNGGKNYAKSCEKENKYERGRKKT